MTIPGTAERFWKGVRQHIAEYAAAYLPQLIAVEVTEVDAVSGWVKVKLQGRDTAVGGFRPVLSNEAVLQVGDTPWALAVGNSLLILGKNAQEPFTGGSGGGATSLNGLSDVDTATDPPASGEVLKYNGTLWVPQADTGGVTDHGALTGLADDDHTQYALDTALAATDADVAAVEADVAALEADTDPDKRIDLTLSAAVSVATSTWHKIAWNVENLDPKGWHSNVTNPERITPGEAGTYLVTLSTRWATTSSVGVRGNGADINGPTTPEAIAVNDMAGLQSNGAMTMSFQVALTSPTDYIVCYGRQTTGGNLDLSNLSKVVVTKIR